jgi:uracil-DNA glycosylase family 4
MKKWTTEWKTEQLLNLKAAWSHCEKCKLCETRNKIVFGEGNVDADIVLISEGPGEEEDKTGRPFVGDSGKLLNSFLAKVGIERSSLYITNIVACRPPENRDPGNIEIKTCIDRVYKILYLIDPLLIITAGKVALQALVDGTHGITTCHGKLFSSPHPDFRITGEKNGADIPGKFFPRKGDKKKEYLLTYDVIPIMHPSYILREDSVRDNNAYTEGGLAFRTLNDLYYAKSIVDKLKQEHLNTFKSYKEPRL